MTTTDRQAEVTATLIQLADTLVTDYDLLDYLDLLLNRSASVLDAEAGGVMLSNARGELQVLASTDEPARLMELYELARQQGPSVECFRRGTQVIEEDLTVSERWPRFAPAAVVGGYRAAFSFPMRLRAKTIGALNLFRTEAGGVAVQDVRAAQAFAHMAAIGILQERAVRESRELAGQLQTALNSRVVIEQAKGVIADRGDLDMGEAYERLRGYARSNNLPLRGVAADIVARTLRVEELDAGT
jgi:GAF domain-containing protein